MSMTRRDFTKAGLGAGGLLALGGVPLRAHDHGTAGDIIRHAIPSSGEEVPVVGLGTNRYGVGTSDAERAPLKASLARFHELGGTVVDTAPGYRTSETVLGDLMAELGIRDHMFLATKVDREGRETSDGRMEASFDKLHADTVDLMQVHNFRGWEEAIPLMREWKEEGRLRYVGITTSRESQYDLMEQAMKAHDLDFIQINYSLAEERRSADRILPLAAERGMAVLANRPFGGGGVFGRLGGVELPDWAEEFDCESWAQFLLKYVVSHPAVTAAIPGMTEVRHVADNMAAARGRLPDASLRKRQEAFFDAL